MSDHHFDDDAAERILSGRARGEDEAQLADVLTAFVDEVTSSEPVASAALARAFATGAIEPSDDTDVVPLAAARTRRVRRRSLAVRTAITVGAVSVVFSGVAAAGGLPDPLQSAAADAARVIGVRLPDPGRPATPTPEPGEPSTTVEDREDVVPTIPASQAPPADPRTSSTTPAGPISTEPDDTPEPDHDVAVDPDEHDDDPAPATDDDAGEVDDDPAPMVDDAGEVDDDPAPVVDDAGEVDDDPAPVVEDDGADD